MNFLRTLFYRIFDFIRLRGKYGRPANLPDETAPWIEKFQTDIVQISPDGVKTLVDLHGFEIKKHLVGHNTMMKAKLGTASIYFITGSMELRVLSLSGDIDDIITLMHRAAEDLGSHTISQIRICCASNPAVRKALVKKAGAIKTGINAEVIIRR